MILGEVEEWDNWGLAGKRQPCCSIFPKLTVEAAAVIAAILV